LGKSNTDFKLTMNFRADINGLRAIAVLAVVLFHFDVRGFHGGYVGVDIFFVISGFLMTGMILRRLDLHNFNLLGFYVERARRIVPALLAVCCTLLVCGWFFLFPVEYQELAKHAVGAVTFTSNFMFAKSAGYFEPGSIEKWLLHTCSLSTEWQFYVLYPLLLMALTRHFSSRSVSGILTVAVVCSLALSIWLTLNMPTDAFYLLPARIWELMAGGLVFLFPLKLKSGTQRILEWLGLGMIAYACVRFRPADAWPGWLACVPVFGACFFIASSRPSSLLTGNRFSQFIGKSSYSIYLWHWPIVVALHHFGRSRQAGWTIAGLALSIVLGQISYALIENAVRGKRPREEIKKKTFTHSAMSPLPLCGAAVTLFGLMVYVTQGVANDYRIPDIAERQRFVVGYQNDLADRRPRAYRFECSFFDEERKSVRQRIDPSCTAVGGKGAVFLWGDSYAQALSL
jgi:peptidoglycan/LPS O-acetylase OafA/YrhL